MALFSRNKEADKKSEDAAVAAPQKSALPTDRNVASIIKNPLITEKAVMQSERNVYSFEVHQDATKRDVAEAVESIFNVTPVKVNIVNKKPRTYHSRTRGRVISEKGVKKAYVYLKSGDTINLI